jgi:hypothetical protein
MHGAKVKIVWCLLGREHFSIKRCRKQTISRTASFSHKSYVYRIKLKNMHDTGTFPNTHEDYRSYLLMLINPLNAELNPTYHLLVLLGDLTFMGPCILSIFQYISNKMQLYTVYLYLETALHISGGTSTQH